MPEAKRTAIRAGYVIAFDGKGHRLLRDGVVVIEGDSILHVGPRFDGRVDETVDVRRIACSRRGSSPPTPTSAARRSTGPSSRTAAIRSSGSRDSSRCCPCGATRRTRRPGRACVDFSMAELLRGGVTTVMEIGTLGDYVVERAPHYGLRVYMGQAFRSGKWLTRDGKRVVWEWNEEQGRAGAQAGHRLPQALGRRPRRSRALLRLALADRHLHARAPAGRQALRRRGAAARTRCTPRSPWSSSTRWCSATARRPSRG